MEWLTLLRTGIAHAFLAGEALSACGRANRRDSEPATMKEWHCIICARRAK